MSTKGTAPRFFVIGAPQCGIATVRSWLRQAPDVFLPAKEELNHFADDLLPDDDPYRSRRRWLAEFAAAPPDRVAGDLSSLHMLSRTAAHNVRAFLPAARIVAMVRNPIDVLPLLHAETIQQGLEPELDFRRALELEKPRRRGEALPARVRIPERLHYLRRVAFADQLERWLARFPDTLVVVYDDLCRRPADIFRSIQHYIGADTEFVPDFGFVERARQVRSPALHRFLHDTGSGARRIVRGALPALIVRGLHRINLRRCEPATVPAEVRDRLRDACETAIRRLQVLLGRDLTHWLEGRPEATPEVVLS